MLQQTTINDLSGNDRNLIEEAIRRVRVAAGHDAVGTDLFGVMADQVRRGRRDMFTLVRTGRRAVEGL